MKLTEALFGKDPGPDTAALKEAEAQNAYLSESLQSLERHMMEDEGWRRMSLEGDLEFTRSGIDRAIEVSRAMYMSHPLIRRAINVTNYYTWAQGVTISSEDEQIQTEIIDPIINDHKNSAELFSAQARVLTDVDQMVEGNNFFQLRTDPVGHIDIRSIPTREIREIYKDPEDSQQVMYYKRVWVEASLDINNGIQNQTERTAYYPDWTYDPTVKPNTIGSYPVEWDSPIIHQRTGGLKRMSFGFPETYAAMDWARAYRRFLEDWHSMVASLSRFAWRMTATKNRMKQAKAKLTSSMGSDGQGLETNEQTPAGAVAMGSDITPIPKTGATTSADDARASRLMVASATDLPDTILSSDPQQGALATAKTLDRPTELYIMHRQAMWSAFYTDIFEYAIRAKANRGRFPTTPRREHGIEVTFPSVLEHSTKDNIEAIVTAATLAGKADAGTVPREVLAKLLMEAIGVDDIETALGKLEDVERDEIDGAVEALREAARAAMREDA